MSELESKLVECLDAVKESASQAGEFARAELPLVAQEYIAWCWWGSATGVAFGLLFLILLAVSLFMAVFKTKNSATGEFYFICALISLMLMVVSLPISTYELIKVSVAPRVVLLEKIDQIINK